MSKLDPERTLEFEFLRATESAALNAIHWMGRGDLEMTEEAACDAARGMFDLMDMQGEVTIGQGVRDLSVGFFCGEKVGTWSDGSPRFDVAIDPIDGAKNLARGLSNSLSCIAAAIPEEGEEAALERIPAKYMEKLAYPEAVKDAWLADPSLPIGLDHPLEKTIKATAKILGKSVRDVVVLILDRPRNEPYVEAVRAVGAKLRMINDGEIASALAPALPSSGIDLYVGIGATAEGILAAAALRCLGGGFQARISPVDEAERLAIVDEGWANRLDKIYLSRDLAKGKSIVFCATGISESPLLKGIEYDGKHAKTHSVLMRIRSKTVRFVETFHNMDEKTIRLRSTREETSLKQS